MPTVYKNRTANTGKYSYQYVDIAQIHEYLESIGARYYQYIERIGDDDYIMTVKVIDGKESQPLRGARIVDAKLNGVVNPAQEQGSAITYARRYSLLMAFGLATSDDDAQCFTKPKVTFDEKVAALKDLMTDSEWNSTIDKNGNPSVWKEEQVDKWLEYMRRRDNNA